jgi:hypothetical protein
LDTVSVIFERSRMGLYIFPRYNKKTISRPALSCSRERKPRPVPEYETRPDGNDHLDERRQLGLDASGLESRFHIGQAFRFESLLFVVFPGECLDHADGGQDFLYDGEQDASCFRTAREAVLMRRV